MNILLKKISAFVDNEIGAETVEWVIVAGIITTIIVAAYSNGSLQTAVQNEITYISNKISSIN